MRGRGSARRGLAVGLGALLVVLLSVVGSAPASAHAELVRSTPADGANLAAPPPQLLIELSESVELTATSVTIADGTGRELPVTDLRLRRPDASTTEAPSTLVVTLPHLVRGQYRASWRTLSSDDLHVTAGVVVFGVQQRVEAAARSGEPRPAPLEALLRWLGLLGLGVLLGSVALGRLVAGLRVAPGLVGRLQRQLLSTAAAGAVLALAAAVSLPVAQASRAGGLATVTRLLLHDRYGVRWWAHVTALTTLLVLVLVHRAADRTGARPSALVWLAIRCLGPLAIAVAVVALTLMGHLGSGAGRHPGLVALGAVHLLAAAVWAGSVVAASVTLLGRSLGQAWLRVLVLRRFGALAACCLGVMTVSGLLLAGAQVATPDALLHSAYGWSLLVKVALAAVAMLLGLVNTVALRPALSRRVTGRALPPALLRRTVAAEAVVVSLVLVAAAALASSQPAKGPRWDTQDASVALRSAAAADLQETLQVKPNLPGANFVTVQVFDTRRPSPGPVQQVLVTLTSPGGARSTVPGRRLADGSWVVPDELASGTWRIRVAAVRPGLPDATATYRWVVPDPRLPLAAGRRTAPLRSFTTPVALVLAALLLLVAAVASTAAVLTRRRRAWEDLAVSPGPPSAASPGPTSATLQAGHRSVAGPS